MYYNALLFLLVLSLCYREISDPIIIIIIIIIINYFKTLNVFTPPFFNSDDSLPENYFHIYFIISKYEYIADFSLF